MAKGFFTFKQFIVHQEGTAMKVCTDSCILGAYAPVEGKKAILDIGTGTGLLALMAAQRSLADARIDAVELEENAAIQARQNFLNSPWRDQLNLFQGKIQDFALQSVSKYDLIICNPPFYSNNLKRPGKGQNLAMHSDALNQTELVTVIIKLLSRSGKFVVLLPPYENNLLQGLFVLAGISLEKELIIYDKIGGKHIRTISTYNRLENKVAFKELLYIKNENEVYTPEFAHLLKEYYLVF